MLAGPEVANRRATPRHWLPFGGKMPVERARRPILAWLDLPRANGPRLLTLYLEYDVASHARGYAFPRRPYCRRSRSMPGWPGCVPACRRAGWTGRPTSSCCPTTAWPTCATRTSTSTTWCPDAARPSTAEVMGLAASPVAKPRSKRTVLGRPTTTPAGARRNPPGWHSGRNPRIPSIICQADGWRAAAPLADTPRHTQGRTRLCSTDTARGVHLTRPSFQLAHGLSAF